jgi:hypothetical protein
LRSFNLGVEESAEVALLEREGTGLFGLKISLNGTTETGTPDSVFPQKFGAFSSIA